MSKEIFILEPEKMDLSEAAKEFKENKTVLFCNMVRTAIYGKFQKCGKEMLKIISGIEIAFKKEKLEFTKKEFNLLKECFNGFEGWINNPINAICVLEAEKVIENVTITNSKIALVEEEKK